GPGDILSTEAVAQEEPADDKAEGPARQHEVEKKGDEPQAQGIDVEAEEQDGEDADRHDAYQHTDDADDHHRQNVLERPQRADQKMAEIAGIHLLEEGQVETELTAE